MNDQATTLREMAKTSTIPMNKGPEQKHSCTIAVTGGKGGVGKSNVAVNLALELAANGRRVSLLDADLALANADVLLGLNPRYHLGHVLSGEKSLADVVIETNGGVRLIPAGSGIEELANLPRAQQQRFIAELSAMEDESDFLIVDTPAGIGHNVTSVMNAASAVIIVTTPDPTAVIDAYATLKVLHQQSPGKPVWVVVNDVVGIGDAEQTFGHIQAAAIRFLRHPLVYIGTIPRDSELADAVRKQVPVVQYSPQTPASRALRLIARWVDQTRFSSKDPAANFWQEITQTPN
ncbi:MAG TPA: MinD/ParA family protein [Pyrinomonadaceae bacterium]|nr:MinD/ParA family protein [Pyrinomonadaceae bacterium]